MKIILDNTLRITTAGINPALVDQIKDRLTLVNPAWEDNEKYNRWNGNTPDRLRYYDEDGNDLVMPRGFLAQLKRLMWHGGVSYNPDDRTRLCPEVGFTFRGSLHSYQEEAVEAVLAQRIGILQAPPGSGKTVIALRAIAVRRQPALVIVHTKELLYQWRDRAATFLDLDPAEIGLIGDGKEIIGDRLTIAIVNSLYDRIEVIRDRVGHLIVDECHRTPANMFNRAVAQFDCRYLLGLSATPFRRDRLTKVIYLYLGDRVHEIQPGDLQAMERIAVATLRVRRTAFDYDYRDEPGDYARMLSALTCDRPRNRMIVADIMPQATRDGIALVISDRIDHLDRLKSLLDPAIVSRTLTGSTPAKSRKAVVAELGRGVVKVLFATAQLIGEGFDCPGLTSIFLATPIRFSGKVIQAIGRIMRPGPGKEAVIHDYIDGKVGVLESQFKSRLNAYEKMNVRMPVHAA